MSKKILFCIAAIIAVFTSALKAETVVEFGCILLDTDHPDVDRDWTEAFVPFCDIRPDQSVVQCYALTFEGEWEATDAFAPDLVLDRQEGGKRLCPAGTDDGKLPTIRG